MLGYTTYNGGLELIENDAEVIQLTLNGRQTPGKRDSRNMFIDLCDKYPDKKVVCHYDFIYIISRFAYFDAWLRRAIIDECYQLLTIDRPNFVGVVMHTDFSFKKEVYLGKKSVDSEYNKGIWNKQKISDAISSVADGQDLWSPVYQSIKEFYDQFKTIYRTFSAKPRIFLETSVHCAPDGRFDTSTLTLIDYVDGWTDLFGVCYDTEHEFALTGISDIESIIDHLYQIPHIVHLNTIPAEVAPESGKDRHSDTTLWECSRHSYDYYRRIIDSHPECVFIREIKDDAIQRELSKFHESN